MHNGLVADDTHHATTAVQITTLGERDQALSQRTKALSLRQGGGDAAALEQAGSHVREHKTCLLYTSDAAPAAIIELVTEPVSPKQAVVKEAEAATKVAAEEAPVVEEAPVEAPEATAENAE